MGYVLIAVQIDAEDASNTLRVMSENMADLTDPLTQLLELGLKDSRAEIDSLGALFGGGWPVMSPWTPIVARTLYGKERDTLNMMDDSGRLIASLFRGGDGNIFEVSPREGTAGTRVTSRRNGFGYAAAQQYGTGLTFLVLQGTGYAEHGGIPKRPFMSWRDSRMDEYAKIFARHAFDGVEGFSDPDNPGVRT